MTGKTKLYSNINNLSIKTTLQTGFDILLCSVLEKLQVEDQIVNPSTKLVRSHHSFFLILTVHCVLVFVTVFSYDK